MKRLGWLIALMVLVLGCMGAASAQLSWDNKEFMGLDEIKPGMVGYGKTVFLGTKVETFDIEVVGVLKKVDFGFDMILIKFLSGPVVDRKLQGVEGMSGSPIYIDDRLIGAYAFAWDFQQEPIGGVTPIANMLDITEPGSVTPMLEGSLVPSSKVLHIGKQLITRVNVTDTSSKAAAMQTAASPTTMVMHPVATPLFVSGVSEKALGPLQKLLDHYNLRAMPGPGEVDGPPPALEPGSAVAVSLMEGDANMSAVGTVTYVKGNTVLAFGHPFMQLGKVDMPMSAAYVHGIVNSAQASFKLASPCGRVGRLYSDRGSAVAGTVGEQAHTIPVSLYLTDQSRNFTRRFAVDMISNPDFSPTLLYKYIIASGATQLGNLSGDVLDDGTFTGRMLLKTDKLADIDQTFVVSPKVGGEFIPFGQFYLLNDLLMTNPYEDVKINSIFVDLKYQPERNFAYVEKVVTDRPIARPGETVNLTVKIRPYGKGLVTQQVAVKVPQNVTDPVMLVAVLGGSASWILNMYTKPMPTPEQGIKGIMKYLTDSPSSQSLVTAEIFPSPSYGYRGRMLRDMPPFVYDLLRYADTGMMAMAGSSGQASPFAIGGSAVPTTYVNTQSVPYVLTGLQLVVIPIETDEHAVLPSRTKSGFSLSLPVLSSSLTAGAPAPGSDSNPQMNAVSMWTHWMTPSQRARFAMVADSMQVATSSDPLQLLLPQLKTTIPFVNLPFSLSEIGGPRFEDVQVGAQPDQGSDATSGDQGDQGDGDATADTGDETDTPPPPPGFTQKAGANAAGDNGYGSMKNMLTKRMQSWGLTGRTDFLKGKHIGTGVTSRGNLVLVPSVKSIFQTTDMVPWRMVSIGNNTYVAGWSSNQIVRLDADDKSSVFYTREGENVQAITALTADAQGNLLLASWPEQHVIMVSPDGKELNDWQLPNNEVWSLIVAPDGTRFAACDEGMVYKLLDDKQVPLQVACSVPDKHVVDMAIDGNGDLLLATSPRGKVYRFGKDGLLRSVFEGRGAVTSMAVDKAGNLYAGMSPTCQVIRISPTGIQDEIMRGMGRGNRHILAMRMVGDDLYVSTGPAGGIYRVTHPAGDDFDVTPIFAREDQRIGDDENQAVGPESVMVNDLAVNGKGNLMVASSTPGQVLELEPRLQGAFISTVLQTPVVTKWGRLEMQTKTADGQNVAVESRSGNTALPDVTWSNWSKIAEESSTLTSPPATYAQFRVVMKGTDSSPSLAYARLFYLPANQAPILKLTSPTAGLYWSGTKDIRWEAKDPDEDELTYTVFLSSDNGKNWSQLKKIEPNETKAAKPNTGTEVKPADDGQGDKTPTADGAKPAGLPVDKAKDKKTEPAKKDTAATPVKDKASTATSPIPTTTDDTKDDTKTKPPAKPKESDNELHATSIPWDTKTAPDGQYLIRVTASDKYAKPTDPKSTEVTSGLVIIDNAPPTITLEDKIYGWSNAEHFVVKDNLSPIVGGKYRIDDGPWTALVADDGMFNQRQEAVRMITPTGDVTLTKGEFKLQIQVLDAAGNLLDKTITILSGQQPPRPSEPVTYLPLDNPASANNIALLEIMLTGLNDK